MRRLRSATGSPSSAGLRMTAVHRTDSISPVA